MTEPIFTSSRFPVTPEHGQKKFVSVTEWLETRMCTGNAVYEEALAGAGTHEVPAAFLVTLVNQHKIAFRFIH
jgi:hypothetical protein